jgi:predicted transcriptional regulator
MARDSSKAILSVEVPAEMKVRLKEIAARSDRSLSAYARRIFRITLAAEGELENEEDGRREAVPA